MKLIVNGEAREIAAPTLDKALEELEMGGRTVATALNGAFVPARRRAEAALKEGDRLEVLTPMQGG